MSVNRLLKKRRQQNQQVQSQQTPNQDNNQQAENTFNGHPQNNNYVQKTSTLNNQPIKVSKQDLQKQEEFQKFAEYTQYNPSTYQFTNSILPCNATAYNRYRMPLSAFIAPVSFEMDPVQRSADKIPRCGSCRAYMNYYNQCKKKSYRCFICGRQNGYSPDYVVDTQNVQLNNPSYHVLGGQKVYQEVPPQNAFTFLIDLNNSAFTSKMLYYFTAVMKEVLNKQQMDELQIYFFTYDQVVHEYDFSGDEVKCTVFDQTIKNSSNRPPQNFLGNIREKLFNLLDSLQQIAQNNKKQGSSFLQAYTYVYEAVKHTGGKIFIFQANQSLIGQPFMNQNIKNPEGQIIRTKSFLQSKNKTFFNAFIQPSLNDNISCAFFIFQRAYKNIRVLSDYCKLTNSELNLYKKQSSEDLMKFYYDFYYLLSTNYYCDVRMELVMGPGWYFTAVYGNLYRAKQYISFKFCHLQPSKKVCLLFLPQQTGQLPYFSFQVITNYLYNRQHFMTVNTVVLPITCMIQKIFQGMNYSVISASVYKSYLSSYRLEQINTSKNKMVKQLSSMWKASNQFYKKKISPEMSALMLGALAFLKSQHSTLDSINDTIGLDNVVSQRNYLQSCNYLELNTFFCPYLFNLSNMEKQMCQNSEDQQFIYPQVLELKFNSVKDGIFLMDWGMGMFLYIAKQCDPNLLKQLFGKQKLHKNDQLTEQNILAITFYSKQVTNLIKVLRQQKGYGWVPLHIIRCGETSPQQKLFYLNFYAQKYQQYRSFKMNVNQFFQFLDQQY